MDKNAGESVRGTVSGIGGETKIIEHRRSEGGEEQDFHTQGKISFNGDGGSFLPAKYKLR